MSRLEIFPYLEGVIVFERNDWMLQDIIRNGQYEAYVRDPLLEVIGPETTVLDLGANVGALAIPAARIAKHVVAVEMNPRNAKAITISAALNGLNNITVLPCAVSDALMPITFRKSKFSNSTVASLPLRVETEEEINQVLGVPIDLIVDQFRPHVIKMDIEGYEYRALHRASRVWEMSSIWFIEFSHDHQRNTSQADGVDLLRLFFDRGYSATILHRDMRREAVGQDVDTIYRRWQEYMGGKITHLDMRMDPEGSAS